MVGTDGKQFRLLEPTFVDGQRAARGERTAGIQPGQRRRCAGDRHQPGALCSVQPRNRAQQPDGVGHSAVPVKVVHLGGFDDPPRVHHQRPVGELGDHTEVVRDDQHPGPGDVPGGFEDLEDLRLHGDIECGGGLVADQQVGVVGDRDRDDDPLPFTAGELVRKRAGAALRLGDAHQLEQFHRAMTGRPPSHPRLVDLDRLGDLVADGVHRCQSRHRILEHHADRLAAEPRHRVVVQAQQLGVVQPDRAAHPRVLGQ